MVDLGEVLKLQCPMCVLLQGSAHTGPALSPAEVLVAIHDINPERDGLPLKKVCLQPLQIWYSYRFLLVPNTCGYHAALES